jgi:glutamate carboxypeptidase
LPVPDYLTYFQRHQGDMLAFLVRLVEHESPTGEKAAVDRCGDALCDAYRALGADVEAIPQAAYGDHRRITLDPPGGALAAGGQVTVLCHLDTVWARGELARRPIRTEGQRLYGPGIYDMKGGTMLAYYALLS